jgi:hypothetical protein
VMIGYGVTAITLLAMGERSRLLWRSSRWCLEIEV